MSSPQSEKLFTFFFETYALALRNPRRFGDFLKNAVEDWLEFVAEPLVQKGLNRAAARAKQRRGAVVSRIDEGD